MGAPVAPPGMRPAEPAELLAQGSVPVGLDRLVALGGAVLADQLARPPLGHPEHPLQVLDGAAPPRRAHQFPRPSSFSLDLELLVSHDPLQPSVLGLQLLQPLDVVGLQPAVLGPPTVIGRLRDLQLLATSGSSQPSASSRSASRSLRMICSGVCLRRFIESSCPIGAIGLS